MKHKLKLTKPQKIVLLCLLPFAAAGLFLLAKAVYARWVMPHVPPCLLRTMTGYLCPSCGLTHAAFALARGDIPESLRQNAILMFGVLLGLLRYLECWLTVLGRPKRLIPRRGLFWIGVLVFWLGYTVIRNVIHVS